MMMNMPKRVELRYVELRHVDTMPLGEGKFCTFCPIYEAQRLAKTKFACEKPRQCETVHSMNHYLFDPLIYATWRLRGSPKS
jgi:hypothetical protein